MKTTLPRFRAARRRAGSEDRGASLRAERVGGRHLGRDRPAEQEEPAAHQGHLLGPDALAGDADRAPSAAPVHARLRRPRCSPTSRSCTATAPSPTTSRSSAGWRASTASLHGLGHQKGRDTKERALRNFGMSRPEGYRKALRLMKLAEKFGLPVFTFVDTPGAYPGHRRRGARPVGGDRPQHLRDGAARGADHRHDHRRGRLGRRARDQRRRPAADAAVLDLLGDLARRLRLDPVEDAPSARPRRPSARHHGAPPEGARPGRQDRQRAGRRRAPRPQADGRVPEARPERRLPPGQRPAGAASCVQRRYDRLQSYGRFSDTTAR